MDALVKKLSEGYHPVGFESRTKSMPEIKERLNSGFVFITFTKTQGGTEIGINTDSSLTYLGDADFEKGKGWIKVVGTCELNYHKVRCTAEIDLETRKGTGSLELLA